MLPLLFVRSGKTRSHFALLPLFWHFTDCTADKSTTVVFPYWHRRWGGETTDGLFPLLYYRRGARPGGNDETSFTLFPLVYYRRDAAVRIWATPLAASARGPNRSAGFIGPYVWYDDKELAFRFIPLLHADVTRHATGERTRQFGPYFQIDGPGRTTRVLFPLYGRHQRPARDRHLGVPQLLPHAAHERRFGRRAAAVLLAVVVRRQDDDGRDAVLRSHRARRAQLGAGAVHLPRQQPASEPSP